MSTLDPARPLTDVTPNLRRRRRIDRLMRSASTIAAVFAVIVLGIVIATVVGHGAGALSIPFLTQDPVSGLSLSTATGGIAPAIIGSALLVGVATVIALPIGVLIAIYLTEFSRPATARPIRMALDLLNGMPSIVIGVFVFGLLVAGHHQSGFAGSFALAIIMIPLLARTTQEMLLLVPKELRDAAHALGVSRWRTIVGIVLPGAVGGILTGAVLAIARAAGETAPLLLVCSIFGSGATVDVFGQALPNIPIIIFQKSETGLPADTSAAWGAALVLVAFILIGNLSARAMLARQRRVMSR
jgi:phosphate transport system permease protein